MLSDWYKRQKARKEAPRLFRWVLLMPLVGCAAVFVARWAIETTGAFLSADQANFMVSTLVMMAVAAFVYCGYCAVAMLRLARESRLSVAAMLRSGED